jgi:thioesterase domain-containing protein
VSVAAFLAELRKRDMEVWADGDQLRCNAPAGALTPELRDHLRERKNDILEFLRSAEALARQQRAIVPLQPRGVRPPVYAIGGHNGDVFCYRALAQHLGVDQPFFGLQPPGLDGRSEPLTSVEDLAAYFAEQIRLFHSDAGEPAVLAGFCAGGAVAFELGRQLQQQGFPVSFVALFAGPYPSWYRFLPQLRYRLRNAMTQAKYHVRALAPLSFRDRRRYIANHLRHRAEQRAAASAAPDPVLIPRHRVEDATLSAVRRYKPTYFPGRLTLLVPNRRWLRSATLVRRWHHMAREIDEYSGPDGCEGDVMLREPAVAAAADLFRRCREEPHP